MLLHRELATKTNSWLRCSSLQEQHSNFCRKLGSVLLFWSPTIFFLKYKFTNISIRLNHRHKLKPIGLKAAFSKVNRQIQARANVCTTMSESKASSSQTAYYHRSSQLSPSLLKRLLKKLSRSSGGLLMICTVESYWWIIRSLKDNRPPAKDNSRPHATRATDRCTRPNPWVSKLQSQHWGKHCTSPSKCPGVN